MDYQFLILSLSSLFALINPIGITPIVLSLTEDVEKSAYNKIILEGTITAGIILVIFALIGEYIFSFYAITQPAFKIAGGIIFIRLGFDMLDAKVSRTKSTPKETLEADSSKDISLSPIGIPIIAGPGAITSVMILGGEADGTNKITFYLSILICLILTLFILYVGKKITRQIGTTGLRVIQRIMGLLLMVIAVQFIINGILEIIKTENLLF